MRTLPQESHCDLGLIDNDDTEDLRPNKRTAPVNPVLATPAEAAHIHHSARDQEN